MTKKHLQFCIYYMQTGDPQVAYKMTYPHAAVKSLKASVSRLMARPDVAEWVNGTEERVHNRMMRQFHSEHYDQFKEKLLTINEKRTVLTKIIKGETKRVRYVKVKYGVQKVEEDLSADTVLRAIDLDTRLENFYNYLTRSDTWRKTQNIYVNTPTLQQQVNILINQTAKKEENADTVESIQINSPTKSPLQGDRGTPALDTPEPITFPPGRGVTAVTGVEHSCSTHHKHKIPRYLSAKSTGLLQKKNNNRLTTEPVPPNAGLTQKKNVNKLPTEPVSSLTQKKDINRLTKVNNLKRHQDDDNNSPQHGCST